METTEDENIRNAVNKYGSKYLKFEKILRQKIKDAEIALEREEGNMGENRVTYLLILSTLNDVLNDFLEIKKTDFRYKESAK
jgi:hypothetical protein